MNNNKRILSLINNNQKTILEIFSNIINRNMKLSAAILGLMGLHTLPSEASGKDLIERSALPNHLLPTTPLQVQTENHEGSDQKRLPLKRLATLPAEALGKDLIEQSSSSLSPLVFPAESSTKKPKLDLKEVASNLCVRANKTANSIIEKAKLLTGKTLSDEPEDFISRVTKLTEKAIVERITEFTEEDLKTVVFDLSSINTSMDKIITNINDKLTNKNKSNIDIEIQEIANYLWDIVANNNVLKKIFYDNQLGLYMDWDDVCFAGSKQEDIKGICSEIRQAFYQSPFAQNVIKFLDSIIKQIDDISETISYDDYKQHVDPNLTEISFSLQRIQGKLQQSVISPTPTIKEEIENETKNIERILQDITRRLSL